MSHMVRLGDRARASEALDAALRYVRDVRGINQGTWLARLEPAAIDMASSRKCLGAIATGMPYGPRMLAALGYEGVDHPFYPKVDGPTVLATAFENFNAAVRSVIMARQNELQM
jgi:hypothetical protein